MRPYPAVGLCAAVGQPGDMQQYLQDAGVMLPGPYLEEAVQGMCQTAADYSRVLDEVEQVRMGRGGWVGCHTQRTSLAASSQGSWLVLSAAGHLCAPAQAASWVGCWCVQHWC